MKTIAHAQLMEAIQQFRDNLIDADAEYDATRQAVDRAREDQERARRERNRIARHLQDLIDLHREYTTVAETFGPAIADAVVVSFEARV